MHDAAATGVIFSLVAAIPLCIWSYLLLARGSFWRVRRHLVATPLPVAHFSEKVVAVVPARNEADVIARSISSLVREPIIQHVVLVDDGSTDGTAEAAALTGSAKLTIRSAAPKPPPWTGKLWALSQGLSHADALQPDYFLLTDADIEHGTGEIALLVRHAAAQQLDLASYMVQLHSETFAEKALIPAFVFFFLMLYPPLWISSPLRRTAGAAGGCILIRSAMLKQIGGLRAISAEIIDDCALARAVKQSGGRVWLGLTRRTHSLRPYGTFSEIGRMISRTAFNQLRHSALLLIATQAGLFVTFLLPPVLLLSRKLTPKLLGAAAYLLMSASYLPTVRFYKRSPLWALALPPIALFYAGATVYSALRYWRGKGGEWKGRLQDTQAAS